MSVKTLSPVFSQNIYQGVYESLSETEVPEDISLFEIDGTKYPTLALAQNYVQSADLRAGDCLYIPSYHFY